MLIQLLAAGTLLLTPQAATEPATEPATGPATLAPAVQAEPAPFPPSTALAEGLSPEALGRLDAMVQGFVDDGEIIGAELMVLKNGRTVLHEGYGLGSREDETPLEPGSLFCVRSMTKPVIAASILMLIDDNKLELDDKISAFMPEFDTDGSREITVENLLQHTSGLPMSLIMSMDWERTDSIRAVAGLWAGHEPEFEPGTAFNYSDQGTDTLTALIEIASGMIAAEFVEQRVLGPLGMTQSTCVLELDDPLRELALSKYVGSNNAWTRFWTPTDAPLFPFFLGSQGLYSTLEDYAKFLNFWANRGRLGRERLLGARYVRKTLTPGPYPLGPGTGFTDSRMDYGYLMQLWTQPRPLDEGGLEDDAPEGAEPERQVAVFGHTGSDGTHAWYFPEQDAQVLYFTQSRGTLTGLRVEEALSELLLGAPFNPNELAPPLEEYLGYYWEGPGDKYRAIIRDGDDLALEIPGRAVATLVYTGEDRWKLRDEPINVFAFDRDESGKVVGYHVGEHQEFRFEPSSELVALEEISARVVANHRADLLETLGPMRMRGTLEMPKAGREGKLETLYGWPDLFRFDATFGKEFEQITSDGEEVWSASHLSPAALLEDQLADQIRSEHLLARFGKWSDWYDHVEVIQELEGSGKHILVVRLGDTSAPADSVLVDLDEGTVFRIDAVSLLPGVGRMGTRTSYADYRDVEGMLLPFAMQSEYSNSMIGSIITEVESYEVGVELPDGAFTLAE